MNPTLRHALPWLLVAISGLAVKCGYDAKQREIGAMRERLRISDSTLQVARQDSARLASTFRVDTVRLTRTLIRRDTILASVDQWLHDTVPVPVEVVREVIRADSQVIAACRIALGTCEERIGNAERRVALLTTERDVYRKLIPSGFQRTRSSLRDAAIGAAFCFFLCPR